MDSLFGALAYFIFLIIHPFQEQSLGIGRYAGLCGCFGIEDGGNVGYGPFAQADVQQGGGDQARHVVKKIVGGDGDLQFLVVGVYFQIGDGAHGGFALFRRGESGKIVGAF